MIKLLCTGVEETAKFATVSTRVLGDSAMALVPNCVQSFDTGLSPQERQRICESLWQLRRAFGEEGQAIVAGFVHLIEKDFGGFERFKSLLMAWAHLIDDLILSVESEYPHGSGRGQQKRREVEGALLYLLQRSQFDLPRIPNFLEPALYSAGIGLAIDLLHAISQRNRRWSSEDRSKQAKKFRGTRHRTGHWLTLASQWLAGLAWRITLALNPVSDGLRTRVDEFLAHDPEPITRASALLRWLLQNSGHMLVLTELVSAAVREAQFWLAADEQRRRAYAKQYIRCFIDMEFQGEALGGFSRMLLELGSDVLVDLVFELFAKRAPDSQ